MSNKIKKKLIYLSHHLPTLVFAERVRECESDNEGEIEVLMRKRVLGILVFIYLFYLPFI